MFGIVLVGVRVGEGVPVLLSVGEGVPGGVSKLVGVRVVVTARGSM